MNGKSQSIMQQTTSTPSGDDANPLETNGLCLLSLDGGGVRGLSTLYILKNIMDRLNHERKTANLPKLKPCELFDLIGGTSTGGLIAIMLGRLEMDVDECIVAYSDLAAAVFSQKKSRLPFNLKGKVKAQFDSSKLEKAIRETITGSGFSEADLFNDGNERGCKTFVCSVDQNTKGIVRLRSYGLSDETNIPATICQAGLATSAATTFFEPVRIGNRTFADGGLGANNPVEEVEGEAANIWCSDSGDLKPLVKCFISIGTGNPGIKPFEEGMFKFLGHTVVDIATETEETERRFIAKWRKHFDENRYFRFNVDQGLQDIGLDEYNQQGAMESATERYLVNQAQKNRVRDSIKNLSSKQNKTETSFAVLLDEFETLSIQQQHKVVREVHCVVPFERNPCFTGREHEIARLERMVFGDSQTAKIAVSGLGGVGKTSLVIELVHRSRERHKDCSIFWVPANDVESLQQAYLNICQRLRIPGWETEKADIRELVRRYLSEKFVGQWLLVFDNADDINMWIANPGSESQGSEQESHHMIDYIPKSEHGCIIFTTRDKKTAYDLVQQEQCIIEVPELSEAVAMDLLQAHLPKHDLDNHMEDAKSLLRELTYLPLALIQAASYVNKNQITLATYLSLLAEQEEEVIDLLSEDFQDDGRYYNVKNPVATTWLISFDQIRSRHHLAAEYLSFMACVHSKNVPQSLLPPGPSRKREIDAIGTLRAYSFISERAAKLALDTHRLVHLAMRNWLRKEDLLAQWTQKAVKRLADVFPDHDHQNRNIWRRYLTHALYVLEFQPIEHYSMQRINLAQKVGMCLYKDGRWREAEVLNILVLKTMNRVLGQEHPDTLTSMANLASTYRKQGRLKEAEDLELVVLEMRKRLLGQEHPDTVTGMGNLVLTYKKQGRLKEAENLGLVVLKTRKEVIGQEHPDTLTSMGNLASIYRKQDRWKEAEDLELVVLETSKRVLGQEHPDTLSSMANLASIYRKQGLLKEAEDLQVVVLEMRKRVLGQEHPDTVIGMGNLASIYRKQDRWKEAEDLELVVLEMRKRLLGQEHPDTVTGMGNLVLIYREQGRWKEAEDLELVVLETRKRLLGQEHPDTLSSMGYLALTYQDQGRWKEAEDLQVVILEMRKRVLGQEHPDTLSSMGNLATTWKQTGRLKEACKLLEECVVLRTEVLGVDHPKTLSSARKLDRWRRKNQATAL